MIPWTLIFTLAQEAAPEILPEIKRLYGNWKTNRTEPTTAEWDGLLARIAEHNFRKMLDEEASKIA